MANLDDWKPVRRNTSRYLVDLEAWVNEFVPWSIEGAPPLEGPLWEAAQAIARRMVASVARTNAAAWRKTPWLSRRIYAALQAELNSPLGVRVAELIDEQAKRIVTLPGVWAQRTQAFIGQQQRAGLRSSAIAKELAQRLPLMRKSSLKGLARTGVASAETALTQARSERLGIHWYEWNTSEDQRVRPSHRKMDKILVAWSDPAAPEQLAGIRSSLGHYQPGEAPYCRCLALPLVSVAEVAWPHRIYAHGTVARVSRQEFERYAGVQAA